MFFVVIHNFAELFAKASPKEIENFEERCCLISTSTSKFEFSRSCEQASKSDGFYPLSIHLAKDKLTLTLKIVPIFCYEEG